MPTLDIELRKWAFEQLREYGTQTTDKDGKLQFLPWDFTERMKKAGELAEWLKKG